jgi:tripartite-type tricarboxylate transporter receptor subunit TctC
MGFQLFLQSQTMNTPQTASVLFRWIHSCLAMLLMVCASSSGAANIILIVPTTPAAGPDILARLLAKELNARFGAVVVVDNKPGASGNIANDFVSRAKPDGSTLLVASTSFVLNSAVNPNLTFDPIKDFSPIALLGTGTLCLVTPVSLAPNTLNEFLALAKSTQLDYASPGNGTPQHLSMELFKLESGSNLFHIPFKAASNAINDLTGGHVSAMIVPMHTVLPLYKASKLKMLAVMSKDRSALAPNIPTFKEQGFPKLQVDVWYALLAPKNTNATTLQLLNDQVNQILKSQDVSSQLANHGIDAAGGSAAQLADLLKSEMSRWSQVVKTAHIKAD